MLVFRKEIIRSAAKPCESDIPDIHDSDFIPFFNTDSSVPEEQKANIGKGCVSSILPYKMQNLYTRDFSGREYTVAILENEFLRAEFLPELGGRLWRLYDKKKEKDVIYHNGALIFANLALCNAWFAGGVEWNIGIKGHTPFTCRCLFTRAAKGKGGEDILQMYEYEEKRGLTYCLSFALLKDSLLVHVDVENTRDTPTYMYWWSNIAMPQKAGTRIFVPTDYSYVTAYRDGGYCISRIKIPFVDGKDISRPESAVGATDYFFDIPKDADKWEACIGGDGYGLLHCSSPCLVGRKTFLWGSTQGGKHWNERLTEGGDYLEIQAGLYKTQFEHTLIPGRAKIAWNESYTPYSFDKVNADYGEASAEIAKSFVCPDIYAGLFEDAKPEKPVLYGSGRGYLARLAAGENFSASLEFPKESVTESEKYYENLLLGKADDGTANAPADFTGDENILSLMLKKEKKTPKDDYLIAMALLSLGKNKEALPYLASAAEGSDDTDVRLSLALYEASVLHDPEKAYRTAAVCRKSCAGSVAAMRTYGELCLGAKKYEDFLSLFDSAENGGDGGELGALADGRVRMYAALCCKELGLLDKAKSLLCPDLDIPDMREGEYSVSYLWTDLYRKIMQRDEGMREISDDEVLEKYPIPYALDYRMH